MPLLKLVKKLKLGYSLELFSAKLVLVDVVEVFGARKLPSGREVPAASLQHKDAIAAWVATLVGVSVSIRRDAAAPTVLFERKGLGMPRGSRAGSRA